MQLLELTGCKVIAGDDQVGTSGSDGGRERTHGHQAVVFVNPSCAAGFEQWVP
jgi:hypothetical protein